MEMRRKVGALSLLAGLWFSGDLPAQANPPENGDTRYLQSELIANAELYAESKGYRFGDGANVMLRNSAGDAARDIVREPAMNRGAMQAEANRNFEKFVDAMIEASKEIPGYSEHHPGVIGEATFARALKKVCPLWPICKGKR